MLTILILILSCGLTVISLNDHPSKGLERPSSNQPESPNSQKDSNADQQRLEVGQKVKQVGRLLPRDARVVLFDPDGDGKSEKAIITAHLKDRLQQQTVVVYEQSVAGSGASTHPLFLGVLSARDGQLYKEWETQLAGPQLWTERGKDIGLQIVDVNADGKDEIITITGIGASLGANLQIFAWDGKNFQQINPPINGHYFLFDRDGRGNLRIRARSRDEESFHVYEWNGNQYREVDAETYSWREAQFYENVLLGTEPITPYIFGDYLQRAVWNYRRNADLRMAIDLCEQALHVVSIPGKLIPVLPSEEANLTPQQLKATLENFEMRKRSIPALPHLLLGELHEQVGNLEEALKHYEEASRLDPSDQTVGNRIKAIKGRLRSPFR